MELDTKRGTKREKYLFKKVNRDNTERKISADPQLKKEQEEQKKKLEEGVKTIDNQCEKQKKLLQEYYQ